MRIENTKTWSLMSHAKEGTTIILSGDEVALAIDAYLVAHGVVINGPRTVKVNGELCESGSVYADPSSKVLLTGDWQ